MRIGLNLLPLIPGIGGTWNYVSRLISALATNDQENEYVAFVTPASRSLVPDVSNFRSVMLAVPASSRPLRVLFENTAFRYFVAREELACMHHMFGTLPFAGSLPTVVTVHDLMVFTRPQDFHLVKRRYLKFMRRRAARHATILAPVSQATADHLKRQFGVPDDRMEIAPTSIGLEYARESGEGVAVFRARYGLPANFWLNVAETYPHKNHARLFAAFAALRQRSANGWMLAIRTGETNGLQRLVAEHELTDRVVFLPRLPEGEMPLLYSAASALVSPSLFEGGGLPVLEAMACGCPVVASDIPTTREFAPDAALTFDPSSIDSMTSAMTRCEESETLRAELRERGIRAAAKLRSSTLARACLGAYWRAVSGTNGSNGTS